MYYLSPALTSRRGVYHLTRDLVAERLYEGLEFIYSHAKSGILDTPSLGSAVIDGKKCVFCYNCYRACPHAALEPDTSVNQMQCLSDACAGCGTCAGLCPGNAITLEKDDFVEDFGADERAVGNEDDSADADSGTSSDVRSDVRTNPCSKSEKFLVLCCENSAGNTFKDILTSSENALFEDFTEVEIQTVPCGGLIDVQRLTDGLGAYARILSVVCPDDACRHFDGNRRACAQVKRLNELLVAAGLAPERVKIAQVSHAMPGVLRDELLDFIQL